MTTVHTMTLDGGAPCLDFVNSGFDREKGVVTERLHSYEDLLTLAERLDIPDSVYLGTLKNKAAMSKKDAELALTFARDCRLKLYSLFASLAQGQAAKLGKTALTNLDQLFAEAHSHRLLSVSGDDLKFSFQPSPGDLRAPIWQLLLSAYDLLREGNLQYIKQCPRCSWVFIDQTKNHRKKWCSMESCGNAQKTKRYYAQQKASAM